MEENEFDIIIIGGGCAGYPCAVYAKRFNLKTLVIAKERGGLITTTHLVENYPGFISVTGQELGDALQAHVEANDVPISDDQVESIERIEENGKPYFIVKTGFLKKEYKTKTVVIATGTKHKHLGAPGESEFAHKGVSYCATCDGPFFRNKVAAIVGGGDSAAKEAMVLSSICSKVYMFVRSELKAEPINADRVRAIKNIEIIEGVSVKEIKGDKLVSSVELDNGQEIDMSAVFIAIGMLPQSELAKSLGCELNKIGEVKINRLSQTNVEGVYSAGDVTDSEWKQGIIGSAEGSVAAYSAFEHIQKFF
jgi:thioredoxin-disulfide reductase